METFELDEARAMLEPGDHAPIGTVRAISSSATVALLAPVLIRSN